MKRVSSFKKYIYVLYRARARISYLDKELNRQVAEGEVLEVTEERGKVLTTNQFNNVFYCSVVEEAKAEKPPVKRKRK